MDPAGRDVDQADARRHGLWGLGVLAMVAVIVVAFMIIFTGGSDDNNSDDGGTSSYGPGAFGGSTSSTGHASSPSTSTPSSDESSSSSSSPACSDPGASCTPAQQVASVAAAVNALRAQHGLSSVTASASPNAQQCAAARGGGSTCVPHYIFAQVPSTDGATVVAALAKVNASWLLAPDATRIEVGFSDSGGAILCAVLRFP